MRRIGREVFKMTSRAVFTVRGIDCATCALAIDKHVRKVKGVKDVRAAVMLDKVFIDYDESETSATEVTRAIDRAGCASYLTRKEETRSGFP